ncbi:MAG TPA: response regulator transcription factor [Bryobacteraceae bacterium]|nr:response regulator transcription factor [Bryobacteraceae bacterium]HPT26076.1 response regulator transcription factor [Bryobacteraceae bacterium]
MSNGRILVVDDEPQIRRVLRVALTAQGYEVHDAKTGEEALDDLRELRFDLVLLDVNMPGMGGLEACREIRNTSEAAIIMLTVRNSEQDKVAALDAGADDYITKPFGTPELLARIRAALRRLPVLQSGEAETLHLGGVEINLAARRVTAGGKESRLTPKEFDLLHYLIANANVTVSHTKLLQAVWGPDYGDQVEYLRVFINQLRKKIETDPSNPRHLVTEPWVGYRLILSDKT